MARAKEELSVVYRVKDRAATKWKKAQRDVKYFVRKAKTSFNSLKKSILSMKGLIAGIVGVAVIKKLVGAYQEHEDAVTNLQTSLAKLGHGSESAMDDMIPMNTIAGVSS